MRREEMEDKWVVIHSPAVGMRTVEGPFDTEDQAKVYAQLHHKTMEHYTVTKLAAPKR
jgi:hypothetical protein